MSGDCYWCTYTKGNYEKSDCQVIDYARQLVANYPDTMVCVDDTGAKLKATADAMKTKNCMSIKSGGKDACTPYKDIGEKNGVCTYCTIQSANGKPARNMCTTALQAERYMSYYKERVECTNVDGSLSIPTPNPTPDPAEDGSAYTDTRASKNKDKDVCESHYTTIDTIDQSCVFCEGMRQTKDRTLVRQPFCVAQGSTEKMTEMYKGSRIFKTFNCTGSEVSDMNGDDDALVPAPGPVNGPVGHNDDDMPTTPRCGRIIPRVL